MDDPLYKLEYLSLVSKIATELENHLGLNDRILAEFIISLHEQSHSSLPAFQAKLDESGAEFSSSFVENLDRLITTLHPKLKKLRQEQAQLKDNTAEQKAQMLPGLAIQNQAWSEPDYYKEQPQKRKRLHEEIERNRTDRHARRSPPLGQEPDTEPIVNKVYDGRVSGVKDFGAFVTLEGVVGRRDGLVHILSLIHI